MPQMSPFNWTILLLFFLITLILTMSKLSLIKSKSSGHSYKLIKSNNLFSWTW